MTLEQNNPVQKRDRKQYVLCGEMYACDDEWILTPIRRGTRHQCVSTMQQLEGTSEYRDFRLFLASEWDCPEEEDETP